MLGQTRLYIITHVAMTRYIQNVVLLFIVIRVIYDLLDGRLFM